MATRAWMTAISFAVALGFLGSGSQVTHAQSPTIHLEPFATAFNNPIGIDFFEPIVGSGRLVATVNYPTGLPGNLELIDANGVHVPFSSLAGEPGELKVATVRAGPCTGGFAVGTMFVGTGPRGDVSITKVEPDGTVIHPWVALTGEAQIRGSLYQDRACAFGGDLIVVTGNGQSAADPSLNFIGSVWRVNAAGVATRIVSLNKHLEGVITLPNDVAKYGPLAGRIVAGDEDRNPPAPPNGPYGKVFGIKSATDVITVGAADPQFASFPNYPTSAPLNPEDLDLITQARPNIPGDGDLFAVDFGGGQILSAPALDFGDKCGDILVTQEFPSASVPAGLSTLRWNGASFDVIPLINAGSAQVGHFEHVTFRGGIDCARPNLVIEKIASRDVINAGETASFTITVTNQGPGAATGVVLRDTLPAGLTWTHDKPGICTIGSGQLTCAIGTLAEGATFSVTLSAPTTTQDCGVIPNTATVSGTNEDPTKLGDNSASDTITVECPGPRHGCTPGFWKNHATNPPWGGYTPSQKVGTVFTIPSGIPSHLAFRNETLLDALQGGGGPGLDGKTRILLRAATAALLNADNGNPPYPISEAQVISRTNAALASLDETTITNLASLFDTWNNQCDVGSPPTRGPADFDQDGKTEIGVFRPSTGTWYLLQSSTSFNVSLTVRWGQSGDVPVAGDYDGDRRSDIAVYRPSNGGWYILESTSGYGRSTFVRWGTSTDTPVPADYDGDGRTDIAVYRPSTGGWYVRHSSTQFATSTYRQWGGDPSDRPVPGDYDRDGRADIAVYRASRGLWYVLKSSAGFNSPSLYQWGVATDIPVPADYDGDGYTDVAVYRPSTGAWYILTSSTLFNSGSYLRWGLSGDIPVPGDYDGDNRADVAIVRPSGNRWYILKSTSNYTTSIVLSWGTAGDVPVVPR